MYLTHDLYTHLTFFSNRKAKRNVRRVICKETEIKKCISNSMTSSHNDSFVLLFECMFIAFIQIDK